ncbi:MAG: ABC transporter ATP-binding protein [Sulfuritalea sp.]|nr:ABC transporter ATP-binding protein [Sulfuritalea sp.]
MSLLQINELVASHGLLTAVRGVSFNVEEGEILALVGANGAGKTTLFRTIAGIHKADSGRVMFQGKDVTGVEACRRVAGGIALVAEGRRLFPDMTVEENLKLGASSGRKGTWDIARVLEAFPQLKKVFKSRASHLSGGEQQATAIGRALMSNPTLLLLDEVSLGLSPLAVDGVYASLQHLIDAHTTIVLVEQDLNRTLAVAHRIICMLEGEIVADGKAADMSREQVMEHYFGTHRSTHGEAVA